MKKKFLVIGFAVMIIAVITGRIFSQQAIPSGTARYEALGYNPYIMDAAIDLDRNPAWGNKYNNYSFGDIGRYSPDTYILTDGTSGLYVADSNYRLRDQYLGVNFRLGEEWSLGVILNKAEGEIYNSDMRVYYTVLGNETPVAPFKAIVAYNTSTNVTLGFAPYIAYWNYDNTETSQLISSSINRSTSAIGGTFGILDRMNSGWTEGTIGLKFNNYSFDSTLNGKTTTYENDGGLEFNAGYRGWYRIKESKVNIVPYVNFGIFDWQATQTPNTINLASESNWWKLNAGVGINLPITEDGMFAGGISGGYQSNSLTVSDTSYSGEMKYELVTFPQFNMGLEWNLADWLQGRFGYSRAIIRSTYKSTATLSSKYYDYESNRTLSSNPDQTLTAGLGMQFGGFSLDGLIGERFIQQGPNVLSGDSNDLYGVVSISYNFKRY